MQCSQIKQDFRVAENSRNTKRLKFIKVRGGVGGGREADKCKARVAQLVHYNVMQQGNKINKHYVIKQSKKIYLI